MGSYAAIIVDVPAKSVDRPFDYKIPARLKDRIQIGSHVLVPFGPRKIEGFVVEIKGEPEVDKTRDIYKLLHDYPLFDDKMLKLMKWICDYYQAVLINVIKTAIPTGIVGNKVKVKTHRLVRLQVDQETGEEWLEDMTRAHKQAEILGYLLDHPGIEITPAELARKFETGHGTINRLEKKGIISYDEVAVQRNPYEACEFQSSKPLKPTFDQYKAIKEITRAMDHSPGQTILLKGVTGSGKTEVYLQVIAKALEKDQDTIVLVPEIALTPQTVDRFKSRFGANVAVLHSQLSLGERFDEWRKIYRGDVKIVVGARSAIFAPFQNLGLIIIDEEHETSYKQTDQVKYHARDVAIKRAQLTGAVTLLGTATPAVESYYHSVNGEFQLLELPERVNKSPLPPVEIVDMRKELKEGNRTIFSGQLDKAIEKRLGKGEQVILFLNRRGFSNFVLCRECGFVIRCQHCDVSLTYHADKKVLKCHYCDYQEKPSGRCPDCGSSLIKHFGIGTQQVEEYTRKRFPDARVKRMDVDTTRRKGAHDRILGAFRRKELDILIGTQMISKGHDFPNVTLVGVVIADTALHFPDFRSGERTFQLLTQVAGRAGRGSEEGEVVVQTYSPTHYSIKAAKNHDYDLFFHEEIGYRKELINPPFSQMINIVLRDENEKNVIEEAHLLANLFEFRLGDDAPIEIKGPAPAPLAKVRGKYRWQIILKSKHRKLIRRICKQVMRKYYKERKHSIALKVDVDPIGTL